MCKRPGCVAQVAHHSEFCGVHSQAVGKSCERCQGVGSYFYSGQGLMMACQVCGGAGLVDRKVSAPRRNPATDLVDRRGLIELAGDE